LLTSSTYALEVESYGVSSQDQDNFFESGDQLEFSLNATESRSASLSLNASGSNILTDQEMNKSDAGTGQIYTYNHTINSSLAGDWDYTMTLDDGTDTVDGRFQVANTTPVVHQYLLQPFTSELGSNITVRAEVLDSDEDVANVTANISSLGRSFQLDKSNQREGEIVQNKTGVFVEIVSNSGNIESNISVENLRVTSEGQDPWSLGEPIGEEIRYYDGEEFDNVRVGEAKTFFELFKASYDTGNYTGRSTIKTSCSTLGPQNEEENIDDINNSFNCGDLSETTFSCYNRTVVGEDQVVRETTSANLSETSSKTVGVMVENSTGYRGNITLNSTLLSVFSFNSTQTSSYDYGCVSFNSSIEEQAECGYEGEITENRDIKIQDIGYTGKNGSFALMKTNEDYLNTSISCANDNQTLCNYSFAFEQTFSFFENFEIVTAIGDQQGGANQTGDAETNQTIPGDNDEPGQTEVPEPEPEPEPQPEPDPRPQLSIDIQPVEDLYRTKQGNFKAATFTVTNEGGEGLNNVELVPQINKFREDWEVRNALIQNISINETVERDVFVQPGEETDVGSYVVPVSAEYQNRQLDLDYFQIEVLESDLVPKVSISEAPTSINIEKNQSRSVPILIENTGKLPIENVSAELQNIEDCGSFSASELDSVDVNESSSMTIEIEAGQDTNSCNTTMVVSSSGGAYAFSDLQVTILPKQGLIPQQHRVPIVAVLWSMLLAAYAIVTKRYELNSASVKVPFVLLILGETVLVLYTVSNYYALPLAQLLPF